MKKLTIEEEKDLLLDIVSLLAEKKLIKGEKHFYELYNEGQFKINGESPYDINQVIINGDIIEIEDKILIEIVK